MQPGVAPDQRRDEKKDKGGWLSKLKKTSNKPAVLHKPPPASIQQAYPVQQFQPQHPAFVAQQQQQHQVQAMQQQQGPYQQQHVSPQHQQQHWSTYPTQPIPDQRWAGQQGGASPNDSPRRPSEGVSPSSQSSPVAQPQRASLDGHKTNKSPLSDKPQAGKSLPLQAQPNLPSASQGPTPPPADLNRNVSNASTYAASISTVDISEAEAQPMLKGHLVSVRRPPGASAPNQEAQQWSSNPPQAQTWPAAAPNAHRNPQQGPGTPVDQNYVVPPLFSSSKQAATGGEASGSGRAHARDSVVSTVSYRDPRASVVSAMSAEGVTPPGGNKWQRPAPDYSGESWGEEEWERR
jgi:hypothetical protein